MSAAAITSGSAETGVVTAYDVRWGLGTIAPDGADTIVRVHWSALGDLDGLQPGQRVHFVRHRRGRKWVASRVRLVQTAA